MSAWTAILARQLYAALTLRSATSLGVYEHTATLARRYLGVYGYCDAASPWQGDI